MTDTNMPKKAEFPRLSMVGCLAYGCNINLGLWGKGRDVRIQAINGFLNIGRDRPVIH